MKKIFILIIIQLLSVPLFPQKKSTLFERKENFIDIRDRLELFSMILQKYSVDPLWQTVIEPPELDEAFILPDHNLLIGGIFLKPISSHQFSLSNKYALYPDFGPYMKIDSNTGAILWSYTRNGQVNTSDYKVVGVSDNYIEIYHSEKDDADFTKVDLKTGKELFKINVKASCKFILFDDSHLLFIADPQKKGVNLTCYSLDSDSKLYSKNAGNISDTCSVKRLSDGLAIISDGRKVTIVDVLSGEVKSENILPSLIMDVFPYYDSFLCTTENKSTAMFNLKGEEVWGKSLGYWPALCSVYDNNLLWIRQEGATSLINSDPVTGSERWSCQLDTTVKSNIYVAGNIIGLTTFSSFYIIDTGEGKVLHQYKLNLISDRIPDQLVLSDSSWIVSSENGIFCFDKDHKDMIWGYDLTGYFTGISELRADIQIAPEGFPGKVTPSGYYQGGFGIAANDKFLLDSKRDADYWHNEYEKKHDSFSRNMSDLADQGYINQLYINREFSKMENNVNLILSSQQLSMQIVQAKHDELYYASYKRAQARYFIAAKAAMLLQQGNYYIRNLDAKKGSLLFVADIKTGRWGEIVLSPNEGQDLDEVALLKACFFVCDRSKNRIYSNGVGLNPEKWEPVELVQTTTVKRSVLSFDLTRLKFYNPADFPVKSVISK